LAQCLENQWLAPFRGLMQRKGTEILREEGEERHQNEKNNKK
jgi:hypothetical protein